MAVTIKDVQPGSPAEAAGLRGGVRLVAINGHEVADGLDYEFYQTAADPTLLVEEEGAAREVRVQKEEYQPLGCEFESYLIDKQHSCKNRCTFCFIDQLPKGLRPSLYFKDDDERLSFLFGNYITLTNLTEQQAQRIIAMRFSPVNISVHTMNPALRVEMMKNPHAGEVLSYIPRFAKAGIALNFQLVLVPGVNDGLELARSIDELAAFYPATQSIAAVPVGLTVHREGLCQIDPYTKETAARQLDIMLQAGDRLQEECGVRLVYPSDEWFLLAGRPIPPAEFYEDFPQLENGVGMWRLLEDEFTEALEDRFGDSSAGPPAETYSVDLATGMLAAPLLRRLAAAAMLHAPGLKVRVHAVENRLFGPGVTVAGLLSGGDIAAQLQGKLGSNRLLLPRDMLRAEGDVMLDGMTPAELSEALSARVEMVPQSGEELLAALLGEMSDRP